MTNPIHILVIDDEPQILRAMKTILTAKQFRVSTAARGEEGLALAAAEQPDLIILDMSLPDMEASRSARNCASGRQRRSLSCQYETARRIRWRRWMPARTIT
jgi:DNA-binding response OmpR family regulator